MSGIKIYPPNQLPNEGVTDVQFKIWKEELEIYLETEDKFEKFFPGGRYANWEAAESFEGRIQTPVEPDTETNLPRIQKDLRQFVALVAKYVHQDYYNPIVRHSTSLSWIYNKIREDYDIQQQGVHFLNIMDLVWDPTAQTTPTGFYNSYRSAIIGNLAKQGAFIKWKNTTLSEDEKLTPSHEDLILLNVLTLLHPKLPAYIKETYGHKLGKEHRLMDYKTEILTKAKQYIQEIENPQFSKLAIQETPQCHAAQTLPLKQNRYDVQMNTKPFQPTRFKTSQRTTLPTRRNTYQLSPFCRVCQLAGQPRSMFTSHYLGETSCPTLSDKDKQLLTTRAAAQLGAADVEEEYEETDIAEEYGYEALPQQDQVSKYNSKITTLPNKSSSFRSESSCNYIQPVPTQTLTVVDINGNNVHLDLDTGATVSYAKLSTVVSLGYKIKPNSQLSNLADGKTKIPAVGEIDETFQRNNWQVQFKAIVTKNLHCDFVAGNNFIKENFIIQDLKNKTIKVHNKFTVPETNKQLIMPTTANNTIVQNNHISVLLPGQTISYNVPHQDETLLAIQPWFQNKNTNWPTPQLCTVRNGQIQVNNNTPTPIYLNKEAPKLQIRTTKEITHSNLQPDCQYQQVKIQTHQPNLEDIQINTTGVDTHVINYIKEVNNKYKNVFDDDLKEGYNMQFGKHICKLNWANVNRPPASKVHTVNYDHKTKCLLQQVCDLLTEQGVLAVPQDYNIQIQHVSPSFLVRKQKAKNKNKDQLTPKDVRLVVNFGKLNEYLINIPSPITKPKQVFTQLGKWNFIITMDLYSGFFQNHMSIEDAPWLGISTPFGGLRFLRRSGQGLLGQSEELDELLSKILSEELQKGMAARIADDLYIGGKTQEEAAKNYEQVISKLHKGNIKISPSKTKIFLQSVDILGWTWQQGGYISPSPHRRNALKNSKIEDIKTVKDMRSWLGLYKTLLSSSKNLTLKLDPFDKLVADRDSKEPFVWDRQLEQQFKTAVDDVDNLQTLYLPHPDDQLMIVVDAAKTNPGLGHTLYAIKDNKKLPVSFHSTKLQPPHSAWLPCELEALAFANAISTEYETIKETTKPIIISPDSKSVADAVKLITKGKFSTNPRIQTLISNVNRVPIIVQLASGKSNLNQCGDFQSRNPSSCVSEHCSICMFITEQSNAILDPSAINAMSPDNTEQVANNVQAWKKIQNNDKACTEAKYFLKTGKTPSKRSGKTYSEIRRLVSIAKVDHNDMLSVESRQNKFSTTTNNLIVVPSVYLPALLSQLHNKLQHPTKHQLKAQFDKMYYSVGLHPQLDTLYDNCYFCSAQKKIPTTVDHNTETDVRVPGTHFHADVIRRQTQKILIIRDHFSSYTAAKIIKAENNSELKNGIIDLIMPLKIAGTAFVKVDNATGFAPLTNNRNQELEKLNIQVTQTDALNKNENAVVDRACNELEQELKRVEPDGRPISQTTLWEVIQRLNHKLRRSGQISAHEIHFNRDMHTGENLNLNYSKLRNDQIMTRTTQNTKHNNTVKKDTIKPQTGDIVIARTDNDKHKARETYLVTNAQENKVQIQKVLHTHANEKMSLRSKTYTTKPERLHVIFKSNLKPQSTQDIQTASKHEIEQPLWNPIRIDEYTGKYEDQTVDYTSNKHDSNHSPTDENDLPQVYKNMNLWLDSQRKAAHQQIQTGSNAVEAFVTPPTPVNTSISNAEKSPRSQQKQITNQKIKLYYQKKKHKAIPQTDGNYTESSSTQTSPENKIVSLKRHSSTDPYIIDDETPFQCNISDIECTKETSKSTDSLEWDDSHTMETYPEDDPLDNAFCYSPLNLTARPHEDIIPNRVYKMHQITQHVTSSPQFKTNNRKKVTRKMNRK